MGRKPDTDEFEGRDTLRLDPEEKPTELWAPVARRLFGGAPRGEQPDPAAAPPDQPAGPARDGAARAAEREVEEADTEIMPDGMAFPAGEAEGRTEAEREAARLLSDTVEVIGEEAEAALILAERERRGQDPVNATQVVGRPKDLPRLSHECRMCGKKVTRPAPRRLRGPVVSETGFRCEKCNNVFCAAHVVRVSSLWESLFRGGRFRCQLCMPLPR